MEFWTGVFIGFGVGSMMLSLLMLFLIGKVIHGKNESNDKLFEFWEVSIRQQKDQVDALERIAYQVESSN